MSATVHTTQKGGLRSPCGQCKQGFKPDEDYVRRSMHPYAPAGIARNPNGVLTVLIHTGCYTAWRKENFR